MKRRQFIKNAGIAGGLMMTAPMFAKNSFSSQEDFPVIDMHVHLSQNFTIENLMEVAQKTNTRFGVVENTGRTIKDDASLMTYIEGLRKYPVYIGIQPMTPGWSKDFSPEAIAKLDYVAMDPQTFPNGNKYNDTMRIYSFDTYVDDAEKFMEVYMEHNLEVLNNPEPLNIFSWPLFLPVCIARDYYKLWTKDRMQAIITAAKNRNIAIEINDLAHTPHEEFILMAKEQGIKFTFGSDTRDIKTGRLDYCKYIAKKCNLTANDFYRPSRVI